MSSNLMTNADNAPNAEMRKALTHALNENEELRSENEKLRETAQQMNGRMAALTEENEELRKERDNYKQQLEALQEQHAAELREVTEEMAAAARFSDSEWREHCDRVEAEGQRLRSVIAAVTATALELLLGAEAAARHELEREEETERKTFALAAYRSAVAVATAFEASASVGTDATPAPADSEQSDESSANKSTIEQNALIQISFLCRALGGTQEEISKRFLGKSAKEGHGHGRDTSAQARGLWELYLALCDVGFPTDAAMRKLLEKEEVEQLYFNASGEEAEYADYNYDIPSLAAFDFADRVLRHLPKLQNLSFSHLPSLTSVEGEKWLSGTPWNLPRLNLRRTEYTVGSFADLSYRFPRIQWVEVDIQCCTDWQGYDTREPRSHRREDDLRDAYGYTIVLM